MTIPSYQTLMLPLLKFSSRGSEFSNREAVDSISKEFRLTDEERNTLQPNGNETITSNRVRWALFYLKRAMLLNSRRKGFYKITDRGIQVLKQNPTQIDRDLLKQFPEYLDFADATKAKKESDLKHDADNTINKTPEEMLEDSYQIIKDDVKSQLLDTVKRCSPMFFEKLVIELLISMGYGGSALEAGKAIGRTGDEGIDGIIKEDILGLDAIYLQAKKWDATVGRPEIQKFAGALQGQRAKKGIFITTGKFSNDALDYINNIETKIVLIDGNQLAEYMTDHNVGVTDIKDYIIKKVNSDYFEEQV
jgi:restriction system protein